MISLKKLINEIKKKKLYSDKFKSSVCTSCGINYCILSINYIEKLLDGIKIKLNLSAEKKEMNQKRKSRLGLGLGRRPRLRSGRLVNKQQIEHWKEEWTGEERSVCDKVQVKSTPPWFVWSGTPCLLAQHNDLRSPDYLPQRSAILLYQQHAHVSRETARWIISPTHTR